MARRVEISEHLFVSPRTYFWLKIAWAMAGGMTGVTFSDMFPKWVMAVMFLINLGFAEVFRQKAKNDVPPNSTSIKTKETKPNSTTETEVVTTP